MNSFIIKCNNCSGEWASPDVINIEKCPYCNKPLYSVLPPLSELEYFIQQSNKNENNHIFIDNKRLLSLLEDNIRDDALLKRLKLANSEKIPQKLYELKNIDEYKRKQEVNIISSKFSKEYAIDIETANYTVNFFAYLLGYKTDNFTPPKLNLKNAAQKLPCFTYLEQVPQVMQYGYYNPSLFGYQFPPRAYTTQTLNNNQSNQFEKEEKSNLQLLEESVLQVSVEIGTARMRVREILGFTQGTIIELERQAGAPVDIVVNGNLIARGDVVIIDGNFAVRLTEIIKTKFMDSLGKE